MAALQPTANDTDSPPKAARGRLNSSEVPNECSLGFIRAAKERMSHSKKKRHKDQSARREAGRFVALPLAVLDSAAYLGLSSTAKALLLEVARQYRGDDNGRLLLSAKH